MISSQMLKGTLEGCILKVIRDRETYGYQILQQLHGYGFHDMSEGTIYPLLLRLEKNGRIKAEYRNSELGPKRKYFSVTVDGERELENFMDSWRQLEIAVNNTLQSGGEGDE